MCPPERSALKSLFDAAKGDEWTRSGSWSDPYKIHCSWYGVQCSETKHTISLQLNSNGLSGTLSPSIANLSMLEELDLSDNDMRGPFLSRLCNLLFSSLILRCWSHMLLANLGPIPTEIGLLSNLKRVRLNHNEFKGDQTSFGNLKHLALIQLHGNRLSGTIAKVSECSLVYMFCWIGH